MQVTDTVEVWEPDIALLLKVPVTPGGNDVAVNCTVPLKPLLFVKLIVETFTGVSPVFVHVRLVGIAFNEKPGGGPLVFTVTGIVNVTGVNVPLVPMIVTM